jgi:hypothetical protein
MHKTHKIGDKDKEHIVDLKRYEKTELEHDLDDFFGKEDDESIVYSDITRTYYEAMSKYGSSNIKISTNLVPPQIYKIAAEEIEVVRLRRCKNETAFETSEYVEHLESSGAKVTVNNNPISYTIKRIQKIIKDKL